MWTVLRHGTKRALLTMHELRHTTATIEIAGADVREQLGHHEINTVIAAYSHVSPVMHKDAAPTSCDAARMVHDQR